MMSFLHKMMIFSCQKHTIIFILQQVESLFSVDFHYKKEVVFTYIIIIPAKTSLNMQ
jgi:hypothetical protein